MIGRGRRLVSTTQRLFTERRGVFSQHPKSAGPYCPHTCPSFVPRSLCLPKFDIFQLDPMQRDTELTFRDIHGTPDIMLSSLKDIVHSEAFVYTAVEQPLDLRFLEFETTDLSDESPILKLTEKGQNTGNTNYVAVSYTWQRFDPVTNTEAISRFRISSKGLVRKARSQDAVLYRAIQFAKSTNTARIWIDQDCIDQADSIDLEQHLHVVHKIFYQSQYAIALLSFHICYEHQLESVRYVNEGSLLEELETLAENASEDLPELCRRISRSYHLFAAIAADKWFTRTWTFMERLAAPHTYLLVPSENRPARNSMAPNEFSDVRLDPYQIVQLQRKLEAVFQHSRQTANLRTHEPFLDNLFQIIEKFGNLLTSKFLTDYQTPPWTQGISLQQVTNIFQHIDRRENAIQSDRLLILGYLCGFPWRLQTTRLNRYQCSYSTCLFALLFVNGFSRDVMETLTSLLVWNLTIEEILRVCLMSGDELRHSNNATCKNIDLLLIDRDIPDIFLDSVKSIFKEYI